MTKLGSAAFAAFVGGSLVALTLSPASAFTLAGPSLAQPVSSLQIDKVWWRGGGCGWGRCGGWGRGYGWRGYGWRGYGWRGYGWGPAAVVGGLAVGAAVGALAAPRYYAPGYYAPPAAAGHCRRDYYGHVVCN
jgi:hypothetical protein